MIKNVFIGMIIAGFIIIWGSIGALENDNIGFLQCFLQVIAGFALFLPYYLRKLYLRYHDKI